MSYLGSNPYLLNIVPLFNIADPNNGFNLDAANTTLSNIGSIIDTTNQSISVNGIQPYSAGGNVAMTGSFDIIGSLTVNGVPLGADDGGVNIIEGTSFSVSTGEVGLSVVSTSGTATAISMIANGQSVFEIDGLGRALYKGDGISSNVNRLWVSSAIFHADRASINNGGISNMSTIFDVWNGDAYIDGSIFVKNDVHCQQVYEVSDRRLKSDIRPLESALSTLFKLEGVHYRMDNELTIGFIAQDVREVVPEAVTELPSGTLAVNYSKIIPILVEAVKELAAERRT
jgi:hypothetical protein